VPLMRFVWGVLIGAVACGLAYLTQICYSEGAPNRAKWLRRFSVVAVFVTYICFLMGASEANTIFSAPIPLPKTD